MRIAYVAPSLRPSSGWRSMTVGAIRALQRHSCTEPLVVVSREDLATAKELLPGCEHFVVPRTQLVRPTSGRGWPLALAGWWRTRRIPAEPVIVHSLEAYPTGLIGHWLSSRFRCPHVMTAVGTYAVSAARSRLDRWIYERVLRRTNAVCPISRGTADIMRRHFSAALTESTMHVILLGTDRHRDVPRAVAFDRRAPVPPVILSVGAIKPRKGYEFSLGAFATIKKEFPDARYRIVGRVDRPDYLTMLETMIAEEGIRDVEFLTDVSDRELDRHYRSASMFVLTPQQLGLTFEGFGLVYLEAGAYGLPVVGTECGGVPDAVRHGHTGLMARPGDVEEIAECMGTLLRDRALARRLGRGNREYAEQLTWERFAETQYRVYEALLAEPRVAAAGRTPAGRGSAS